jgi:hypothetical protein
LLPPCAAVVGQGVDGGAFHSFSRCNVDGFVSLKSDFFQFGILCLHVPTAAWQQLARSAHTACALISFGCFISFASLPLALQRSIPAPGLQRRDQHLLDRCVRSQYLCTLVRWRSANPRAWLKRPAKAGPRTCCSRLPRPPF